MKILYPVINGEVSGGNIIALRIIEEALKRGYGVVVNSPTEGKFTSFLRERGIKVYNIDTQRTFRLASVLRLAAVIKKEGIDLINSHTPLSGAILSRLAGGITGVPVINHAHMPDYINSNPIIGRCQILLIWFTSRFFCSRVIAVSQFVKREIIKQGVPERKIVVIYNGVTQGDITPEDIQLKIRAEFGLREKQPIIAEVARLGNDKGQHILIRAAVSVVERFPEAVFIIIGEDQTKGGEYKKELERLAANLGLQGKIIFPGYRPDIVKMMSAFDLFVLPTVFMEGLPVVILEAMLAKKAVVATTVGGNPEVVIDGRTGTLIPPENPDKLAEAIIYHLSNPEISRQMGERGYENVRKLFSLSSMVKGVMDVYGETFRRGY